VFPIKSAIVSRSRLEYRSKPCVSQFASIAALYRSTTGHH
jgi:hypothetical protein